MLLQLHAACGSNIGKVRNNNEDNFFFNGRGMEMNNRGLAGTSAGKFPLSSECCFAVFDGMGGAEFGEVASFVAVETLKEKMVQLSTYIESPRPFLEDTCDAINSAICKESAKLSSGRMGTTTAMALFIPDEVYVCNLGDSRVYRLRENEFTQLSNDHVETFPENTKTRRKPRLSQYLGIFPEEMVIEPYIAKGSLRKDDIYLICSDGLTDMMTNLEIYNCLKAHASPRQTVAHLINAALKNGGKDNITVIIIKVQ